MSLKGTISAAFAIISCPCHLPIVLPFLLTLTAGTAWGAWLSANQGLIWVLFTLIFVISLVGVFRWLANPSNQACEIPLAAPISKESRHEQLLYPRAGDAH